MFVGILKALQNSLEFHISNGIEFQYCEFNGYNGFFCQKNKEKSKIQWKSLILEVFLLTQIFRLFSRVFPLLTSFCFQFSNWRDSFIYQDCKNVFFLPFSVCYVVFSIQSEEKQSFKEIFAREILKNRLKAIL